MTISNQKVAFRFIDGVIRDIDVFGCFFYGPKQPITPNPVGFFDFRQNIFIQHFRCVSKSDLSYPIGKLERRDKLRWCRCDFPEMLDFTELSRCFVASGTEHDGAKILKIRPRISVNFTKLVVNLFSSENNEC